MEGLDVRPLLSLEKADDLFRWPALDPGGETRSLRWARESTQWATVCHSCSVKHSAKEQQITFRAFVGGEFQELDYE